MSERKELSTVDAVMNLTHDIELSLKEKKSTTCVFLDVKEAYNYVSIKQLHLQNRKTAASALQPR
jgi:predicted protein tyrosine phosphatase